ncbi:hypothetical protein [Agaribacter flavus]|uniref:HPt domain-containing protein n=1 Tax=Agaribacter flavus TaxID=1902781 RepID=A0ABV7FM47_9ALTE
MDKSSVLIDTNFGLSQLGGNESLYHRMLVKFRHEFSDTPQKVLTAIQNTAFDDAKICVHTTKGIAGNLGLTALYECSKILDKQIKNKELEDSTITSFETLMSETCQAIDALDIQQDKPLDLDGESSEAASAQLKQKLERHEFIDDGELQTLVSNLAMSRENKLVLVEMIEELRYEEAIGLIARQAS